MKNISINNLVKNTTPAIAVMVVGLVGAYFVYDNYFSERVTSSYVSTIEPAAGDVYETEAYDAVPDAEEGLIIYEDEGAMSYEEETELMIEDGSVVEGEMEADEVFEDEAHEDELSEDGEAELAPEADTINEM